MAVYKPLVIEKNETDIKKIMRQLYRFSEDLKFTISNLSLDDNFSKESLDAITERGETVRKIKFDTDSFSITYENYKTGVLTRLDQTEDTISFLVDSGSVVKENADPMSFMGNIFLYQRPYLYQRPEYDTGCHRQRRVFRSDQWRFDQY